MTDTPRPWDRRADESDPAFEAFALYLETGSLRDAYRQRSGNGRAGRVDRMEYQIQLGEPPRRLRRVHRPRVPGRHSGRTSDAFVSGSRGLPIDAETHRRIAR